VAVTALTWPMLNDAISTCREPECRSAVARLPDGRRRLRVRFAHGGSDEGGREEL
jgi:hypothetical protein